MQNTSLAPLKLLCLDGGGCRGYGQLLLLRQLFRYLLPDASVDDIKPSDYFDLIAGSSSGGILSLMLGRLDFSIGEALDAFQQFTRYIYEKDDVIQAFLAGGVYDSERLERAVDQLLNGKDLPMQHLSENPRARVSRSEKREHTLTMLVLHHGSTSACRLRHSSFLHSLLCRSSIRIQCARKTCVVCEGSSLCHGLVCTSFRTLLHQGRPHQISL
jgi:hypothetical protein